MTLSVVIITFNEEANLPRTLKSVEGLVRDLGGEIIVVDSGSTDRTVEIARSFGAQVFVEEWKGFAAQKNSAIEKASGDWVLLLDADEEVDPAAAQDIVAVVFTNMHMARVGLQLKAANDYSEHDELLAPLSAKLGPDMALSALLRTGAQGYWVARKNYFLGRWIKHGGFWPDRKLRLFRRDAGRVEDRIVHETVKVNGSTGTLRGALIHHAYPTLAGYLEHMNRYSSLGAEMVGPRAFNPINIFVRPRLTFFYNYVLRLGFLDGREGLLLHLYHMEYVSWKYAKAWELSRKRPG